MPIKATLSDELYIAQLYAAGKTQKEICDILGWGRKPVKSALVRQGVTFNDKRTSAMKCRKVGAEHPNSLKLPVQEIVTMYASGLSAYEIADHFGVNEGTIRRNLSSAGIKPRTTSECTILRFSRMTKEERVEHAKRTADALRGKTQSYEHRCALAKAREKNVTHVGAGEKHILEVLKEKGFEVTPQKAFGRYNVDIAVNEKLVAVEVYTGRSWLGAEKFKTVREKMEYIFSLGWKPIVVFAPTNAFRMGAIIDNLVTLLNVPGEHHASAGHYPVIWSTRKRVSTVNADINDWPGIFYSYGGDHARRRDQRITGHASGM